MDWTSEPPHFALGVNHGAWIPNRVRAAQIAQHRERERRRQRQREMTSMVDTTSRQAVSFVPTPTFTPKPSMWLILPKDEVYPAIWSVFSLIQNGSFRAVYTALKGLSSVSSSPFTKNQVKIPIVGLKPFSVLNPAFSTENPGKLIAKANQTIYLNQFVRWSMKRLVQRWRAARMKQINEEDPVTMEVPTTPIAIYDWPNRSKYVFDARSLARDFRNKLLHHDLLFLEPKVPRNPFTNAPLTLSQLHFTLNALRLTGQTDWVIEGYRSVGYDIGEFHKRYKHALSLDACRRLFGNPTSEDCVDLVFDFICSEYENHDATMQRKDVWIWFLRNQPTYPRIQMWRSWCQAYYKAYLTETNVKFEAVLDGIRRETAELVDQPMSDMLARWRLEAAGAKTSSLPPAGEGDAGADDL